MEGKIAVQSVPQVRRFPLAWVGWAVAVAEAVLIVVLLVALQFQPGGSVRPVHGSRGAGLIREATQPGSIPSLGLRDDFATRHLPAAATVPNLGLKDDYATRHMPDPIPSLGLRDDYATRHMTGGQP
jgi:hypothetical protein